MKLGCCLNMLDMEADPTGRSYIPAAKEAGCDYVELPLAQIMDLDRTEFDGLLMQLKESGIPCEACNNFFPASVRLTGEDAQPERIKAYLQEAVDRAARLGAKRIVFGSGGAKNVPPGFSYERAWEQIVDALRWADTYTSAAGILIAIEALNKKEGNIILNLTDSEALMRASGASSVRLLVDYYHFMMEKEEMSTLRKMLPHIVHVHFAEPEGRCFPEHRKESYELFFGILREGGYDGRVSLEAFTQEPEQAMKTAAFLREYF